MKTDFLHRALAQAEEPFTLITGSSDIAVTEEHRGLADHPLVREWWAPNCKLVHPKVVPIGLGIENPPCQGSNESAYLPFMHPVKKDQRFFAAYEPQTNPLRRLACMRHTGYSPRPRAPFTQYLREMARSLFCFCPEGNGIDTHRVWEALLLDCVPVMTESLSACWHRDRGYPIIVLRSWVDFHEEEYTDLLWGNLMREWDPERLQARDYVNALMPERMVGTKASLSM